MMRHSNSDEQGDTSHQATRHLPEHHESNCWALYRTEHFMCPWKGNTQTLYCRPSAMMPGGFVNRSVIIVGVAQLRGIHRSAVPCLLAQAEHLEEKSRRSWEQNQQSSGVVVTSPVRPPVGVSSSHVAAAAKHAFVVLTSARSFPVQSHEETLLSWSSKWTVVADLKDLVPADCNRLTSSNRKSLETVHSAAPFCNLIATANLAPVRP